MKRVVKIWFKSEEAARKYLTRGGTMPLDSHFMEIVSDRVREKKCSHKGWPEGYVARQEYAKKMSLTHKQVKCKKCGLLAIWRKK